MESKKLIIKLFIFKQNLNNKVIIIDKFSNHILFHEFCRGYLAPEYFNHLHLSDKIDVYSFGVVILELVTGTKCLDTNFSSSDINIVNRVRP